MPSRAMLVLRCAIVVATRCDSLTASAVGHTHTMMHCPPLGTSALCERSPVLSCANVILVRHRTNAFVTRTPCLDPRRLDGPAPFAHGSAHAPAPLAALQLAPCTHRLHVCGPRPRACHGRKPCAHTSPTLTHVPSTCVDAHAPAIPCGSAHETCTRPLERGRLLVSGLVSATGTELRGARTGCATMLARAEHVLRCLAVILLIRPTVPSPCSHSARPAVPSPMCTLSARPAVPSPMCTLSARPAVPSPHSARPVVPISAAILHGLQCHLRLLWQRASGCPSRGCCAIGSASALRSSRAPLARSHRALLARSSRAPLVAGDIRSARSSRALLARSSRAPLARSSRALLARSHPALLVAGDARSARSSRAPLARSSRAPLARSHGALLAHSSRAPLVAGGTHRRGRHSLARTGLCSRSSRALLVAGDTALPALSSRSRSLVPGSARCPGLHSSRATLARHARPGLHSLARTGIHSSRAMLARHARRGLHSRRHSPAHPGSHLTGSSRRMAFRGARSGCPCAYAPRHGLASWPRLSPRAGSSHPGSRRRLLSLAGHSLRGARPGPTHKPHVIFPHLRGWGFFHVFIFLFPREFLIHAFFLHFYTCLAVRSPPGAMRGCVADALRPRHPPGRLGHHLSVH